MAIKSIRVSNFKSFRDLEVELGPFNVLIGANASGKSNFVQIFRFLRDIVDHGLKNAISMQGGVEYLRNVNIGLSRGLSVSAVSDEQVSLLTGKLERLLVLQAKEVTYEFAISFGKNRGSFDVAKDKITLKCNLIDMGRRGERAKITGGLRVGDVTVSNVGGKLEYDASLPEGVGVDEEEIFPLFLDREDISPLLLDREKKLPPGTLLAERSAFMFQFRQAIGFLGDVSTYDFDPKLPKRAIPITGKMDLEENGSNLAIALRSILEDEEKRRKFLNLLKDVLGFVDGLRVMPLTDRSLLFALQETYTQEKLLPASFISDGTIHVIALIIALYFDERSLVIIEEPERNIHPFLIARVVDMLKEASEKKQIIVTTHNPEVVKHAGVENLLLVSRDKEGFSTITRPRDSEQVLVFLKNEIGIEDLFVQDLLGA